MTADYFALYLWIACGAYLAYHSLKRLWSFFMLKKGSFPYDIPIFWGLIVLEYWYSFSQPRGFLDLRIVEFFLWSTGTVILYLIFLAARRHSLKKKLSQAEPSGVAKVTGVSGTTEAIEVTELTGGATSSASSASPVPSASSTQPHTPKQTNSTGQANSAGQANSIGQVNSSEQPEPQKPSTPQRVLILPQSPPLPTSEEDSPQ